MGIHYSPHTHPTPIPMGIPMGIPIPTEALVSLHYLVKYQRSKIVVRNITKILLPIYCSVHQ